MPDNKSRPPQEHPWENGWAPDTSRAPGTRRLWLAGVLAVTTVVVCVTAIAVNEQPADEASATREGRTTSDKETSSGGGLISFASPSASGSPSPTPAAGNGSPSPSASASPSASPRPQGSASPRTSPAPSAAPAQPPKGAPAPRPAVVQRSVQSVNYPAHHWHVSRGYVRLEQPGGSEFREDATFTLVKGLANSSCHSFLTSDGTYLRHRSFVLVKERNDGSSLFKQDATFCTRPAAASGAVMLESVNYPGYFLRHRNFQLRLEQFEYSGQYRADSAFRLVEGLA